MRKIYLICFLAVFVLSAYKMVNRGGGEVLLPEMFEKARCSIEILPKDKPANDSLLRMMQSKATSTEEAAIYDVGGVLIDNGWIRIFGAGSKRLERSVVDWNKGKSFSKLGEDPSFLLIAEDAISGIYAINKGGISQKDVNKIFYFGPNSLQWTCMNMDLEQFMRFCASDMMQEFYEDFRWKGWQEEVKLMNTNNVISCYPLLWSREGKEQKVNRKQIPAQALWEVYQKTFHLSKIKAATATNDQTAKPKKPAVKKKR